MSEAQKIGMTRTEFADRIGYCKRELEFLQRVQQDMGCRTCCKFKDDTCATFGPVPPEFVAKGCDEWEFDDCPF